MTDTTTPLVQDKLLSRTQFAEHHDVHPDTVKAWLRDGRIPTAQKDSRGQWLIPQHAEVQFKAPTTSVVTATFAHVPADPALAAIEAAHPHTQFGTVTPIAEVAEAMKCSTGTVRRLADAGHLILITGDNGGFAIYTPPPVP